MQNKKNKMTFQDKVVIPVGLIPAARSQIAIDNNVQHNLLFRTWGGLGDQICAEPTLRYVLKNFKDCFISLSSEVPKLFNHLEFRKVYNYRNKEKPNYEDYFVFETITPPDDSNLVWQFFSHMITNCVDFPSLCAIRSMLPIEDKHVILKSSEEDYAKAEEFNKENPNAVYIHAGKHWQSKTFPKSWWDSVISGLISKGLKPVLIGADTDDNRTTVEVDTEGCIDLRNKLSIMESVAFLQLGKVLLTNDSSPLHMAVSHNPEKPNYCKTWIGFVATCKHPDHIMHWRFGKWAWRQENLGLDGIWNYVHYCPNREEKLEIENMGDLLEKCLPDSNIMVEWANEKIRNFDNQF
jgi:hypothetical protein